MPSTSKKQHDFMAAVAHGMKPRKGGPSRAVAEEFVAADAAKSKRKKQPSKDGLAKYAKSLKFIGA